MNSVSAVEWARGWFEDARHQFKEVAEAVARGESGKEECKHMEECVRHLASMASEGARSRVTSMGYSTEEAPMARATRLMEIAHKAHAHATYGPQASITLNLDLGVELERVLRKAVEEAEKAYEEHDSTSRRARVLQMQALHALAASAGAYLLNHQNENPMPKEMR